MAEKTETQKRRVDLAEIKQLHVQEKRKLNRLLERQQLINQLAIENDNALFATKELGGKKETDSIIPLGAGIFASAKIIPHSLKRSLPGNVVVDSTPEQVEKDLKERMEILAKDGEIIHKQIVETRTNMQGLAQLLEMARQQRSTNKK